jgi:hypothetical protein
MKVTNRRAIGCSTESEFLRRRTHKRACGRFTSASRQPIASLTLRPCRYILKTRSWSRMPCLPSLAASRSLSISGAARKSLALSWRSATSNEPSAATLGDELLAIKRYLAMREDKLPWLFVSERGEPLPRQAVYVGHRDPRHTVHYTRVSGRRLEGLWK